MYQDELLRFDYDNWPFDAAIDSDIPLWRCLSTKGLVEDLHYLNGNYSKKLIDEGHEVIKKERGKPFVADYKETEIDYSKLTIMPAAEALKPMSRWQIPSVIDTVSKMISTHSDLSEAEQSR